MEYTFKNFLKNQNIKLSIVSISIVMYFDLNFFIFFYFFPSNLIFISTFILFFQLFFSLVIFLIEIYIYIYHFYFLFFYYSLFYFK